MERTTIEQPRVAWLRSALVLGFTVVALLPILWVVHMAFFEHGQWSLAPFQRLFQTTFPRALLLSLLVSVSATVLGVGTAAGAAFAITRYRFSGRVSALRMVTFSQVFPGVLSTVPILFMLHAMGWLGSLFGVWLVYASLTVPFSVWMLLGYFEQVPKELDEAARLDGASPWQLFWHVHLPLVRPGLAVTSLYAFMNAWNEYVLAATYLSRPDRFTAPIVLRQLVGKFSTDFPAFAAGSILVSLPVMAVFFVLQKQLVSGLMSGSVKG